MAVLLMLIALIAPGIAQNTYYSSCPPSPPSQCPCNVTDFFSTAYLTYAASRDNQKKVDNICYTYFPVDGDEPCTYVSYFSKVYCDGSNQILSFLVTCNSTTEAIYTSPDCSFVETTVGGVGDSSLYVHRIISGSCSGISYPVLGASLCPNAGSSSELDQVNQIFREKGYGCSVVYEAERLFDYQCVTSQTSANTGGDTSKCPSPSPSPCSASGYPNYSYSPPSYAYSPPSDCPYYK